MSKLPFANKALGQHFLVSEKTINHICDDTLTASENCHALVEVGPGPAILSKQLSERTKIPYFLIERDERFLEYLAPIAAEENLFFEDALEFDFILRLKKWETLWIVSNLPYNISVPLMRNFLECSKVLGMTLMMQKEVGEKIFEWNQPKKPEMGSLKALMQTYFHIHRVCSVPPGHFSPPPKVDSVVLHFKRREKPEIQLSELGPFEKFCRQIFANRRKQVGKALKQFFQGEQLENLEKELGFLRTDRAETFQLRTVQLLYQAWKSGSSS